MCIVMIFGLFMMVVLEDCVQGFWDVLVEVGFILYVEEEGDYSEVSGVEVVWCLFDGGCLDVIFIVSDLMVWGVMMVLCVVGVCVFEDIVVVGFDDFLVVFMMDLFLIIMCQLMYVQGEVMVQVLLFCFVGEDLFMIMILLIEFVVCVFV